MAKSSLPYYQSWALAILSLALIASGAFMARNEAAAFFWGAGTPDEQFLGLADAQIITPASIQGSRMASSICLEALSSVRSRISREDDRAVARNKCLSLLQNLVIAMPSNGHAWFVGAFLYFQAEDFENGNRWLLMAQRTSPNEQWIAEARVALAEDNLDKLTPITRDRHEQDLRLLVQSQRGIHSIARRYVENAGFRERITDIVDTLEPATQQHFVNIVRAAASSDLQRQP